jgi:hypothetical protein
MDFSLTPIWVQIHNMPIGCINREVGTQIGSSLVKVEEVAVADDDVGWMGSLFTSLCGDKSVSTPRERSNIVHCRKFVLGFLQI